MLTDVLILGLAQVKNSMSLAGMTTQPDPVTGLRWVRPIKIGGSLTLDDLRYDDGLLVRMGDVIRLDLQEADSQSPFVENVPTIFGEEPPVLIRELTEARRAAFFPKHIDPDPLAVLGKERQRSLCLVRPDHVDAVFSFDEETERFEARLMPTIIIGGRKLSSEDGVPVHDVYWKAWGRQQLGDKEFDQIDDATLRGELGDLYLTLGLNARGKVQIIGVHTVPDYTAGLDLSTL